tara:strand:+ start:1632 stop:2417 length:786 start_codon:yes stop_codon:yes gene_type:complete
VALVTNFKDRIADLAGVQITTDDNAIEQFVINGCYDVVQKMTKAHPDTLQEFAIQSSAFNTDGSGEDMDTKRQIVLVERNSIPCRKIPAKQRHFVSDVGSIYEVTNEDPGWLIFNNKMFIYPTPGNNEGYFYYIPEYAVSSMTSNSSIDNFPKQYYEAVIIYASYMALGKQLINLIQDGTDASLSMDVISKMMNANKPDSGGDVWDYLVDEDSEMVQSTIAAIQAASGITKQKYEWYAMRMKELAAMYLTMIGVQPPKGQG